MDTVGRPVSGEPVPTLVLVGGFAGVGKTTLCQQIARDLSFALLDKDTVTRPFADKLCAALTGSPDDRHSSTYLNEVRPVEYQVLTNVWQQVLDAGVSVIVSAPLVTEFTDPEWVANAVAAVAPARVKMYWVTCGSSDMRFRLAKRNAARDSWKLENWDTYSAALPEAGIPELPAIVTVIDNSDTAREAARNILNDIRL
jgi:predicted kinase